MMMNSYRPNKSAHKRLIAFTALVVFLFLLDMLAGGSIRHRLRGASVVLSGWSSSIGARIKATGLLSTRASLEAQNRFLVEELARYEERAGAYEVLRAENEELRAFVRLAENAARGAEGVTAPVVSSVRTSPYGTFLIGAGEAEGITRGSYILTSGGFVVGTITDTGAHTATVGEVFAPGADIEVAAGGAAFTATGHGGGNARAKISRALTMRVNEPVVSPALGQRPVGIIGSIASSTASASQELFITLPVNLSSLRYVYVLPVRN